MQQILDDFNRALRAKRYPATPEGLYEPIQYVLSLGGKRIRPVLMLLVYSLYRPHYHDIMAAALGLETYHNYTLLHDDLMDRADLRRGRPTVHRRWNPNTAILSGDEMLVLACQDILSLPNPNTLPAMQLFLKTAIEVGEGQQMDMNFETRNDVTLAEYTEMIRLKTSVLLACAAAMGALLAGAGEDDQRTLYSFGEQLGLAFQLQDDLLDAYGDESVFGKKTGGDIVQNKKTWLLINAFLKASPTDRAELEGWIGNRGAPEPEKIKAVINIYNRLHVPQACMQQIDLYLKEATDTLGRLSLPDSRRSKLQLFAQSLCGRTS